MCSHYQGIKKRDQLERYFRVRGIPQPTDWDMWPRRRGEFIRWPPEWDSGDEAVPALELVAGRWGLISAMTRPDGMEKAQKRATSNARSETAAKSYTFGNAWRCAQHCIIPVEAFFEPDWRSGKAVDTKFTRADGAPMGIAGLWDHYRNAAGELVDSFTMLTINADVHPLIRNYHKQGDEKRMVVILPDGAYGDWLAAGPDETRDFLHPYPADALVAEPTPK